MADISPLYMKNVTLSVDSENFEKEVSSVTFTPSASVATWKGLTPDAVHTATGTASWTVELQYAQDWDTTGSLSKFLFDHEGEELDMEFRPKGSGFSGFGASCIITPGAIGGAVDSFATATVSLGVQGRPTAL